MINKSTLYTKIHRAQYEWDEFKTFIHPAKEILEFATSQWARKLKWHFGYLNLDRLSIPNSGGAGYLLYSFIDINVPRPDADNLIYFLRGYGTEIYRVNEDYKWMVKDNKFSMTGESILVDTFNSVDNYDYWIDEYKKFARLTNQTLKDVYKKVEKDELELWHK